MLNGGVEYLKHFQVERKTPLLVLLHLQLCLPHQQVLLLLLERTVLELDGLPEDRYLQFALVVLGQLQSLQLLKDQRVLAQSHLH